MARDQSRAGLPHPHSERWQPYRSPSTGEVVTLTWEQVQAVHHAVRCVDQVRKESVVKHADVGRSHPPLSEDFYGQKSRALGRLLVDGKPLFEELPPYSWGAADYGLWDEENEHG